MTGKKITKAGINSPNFGLTNLTEPQLQTGCRASTSTTRGWLWRATHGWPSDGWSSNGWSSHGWTTEYGRTYGWSTTRCFPSHFFSIKKPRNICCTHSFTAENFPGNPYSGAALGRNAASASSLYVSKPSIVLQRFRKRGKCPIQHSHGQKGHLSIFFLVK